jgi:hypothetical protein
VTENSEFLGFYMLSLSAVAVYPIKRMRRKFMQKSQYKNWKSAGYWRYLS